MGVPLHVSVIQNNIESYIKQLEGLAYSNNQKMMIVLCASIEEAAKCAGLAISGQWKSRVEKAQLLILAANPDAVAPNTSLIDGLKLDDIGLGGLDNAQAYAQGQYQAKKDGQTASVSPSNVGLPGTVKPDIHNSPIPNQ